MYRFKGSAVRKCKFYLLLLRNKIKQHIDPIKFARDQGVLIGEDCRLVGRVGFGSEPYLVSLGSHVSITNSQFITHDGAIWVFRDKFPEADILAPIKVGDNVFIGANCVILPDVIIEDNVIVGAGSVVSRGTLKANSVYAGVPAKYICSLAAYFERNKQRIVNTKSMTSHEKREFATMMYALDNNSND